MFHVITGRSYFFRFCVTARFFQPPCCRFLWNKCFKRSPHFTLSPHYQCGAIANANAKFQNNAIRYYTYTYLKNFLSWLFYENVFYTLFFDCSIFLWVLFEKLKASLKGHSLKRGPRTQDLRPKARKPGPGTQDSGPWTQNIELWTPGAIPSTYLFSYASEGSKR